VRLAEGRRATLGLAALLAVVLSIVAAADVASYGGAATPAPSLYKYDRSSQYVLSVFSKQANGVLPDGIVHTGPRLGAPAAASTGWRSAARVRRVLAPEALTPEVRALSEANLTDSGTTVLGRFPGYIAKAQARGASYFNIGDAWDALAPADRTAANNHFLDVIAERGDRVLTSVPKGEIPETGSALSDEIAYLTGEKGYSWANQWSLRPGG
jgi:hypothetical protein